MVFFAAARPYIWREAQIRHPRGWISLISEITGGEDVVRESAVDLVKHSLHVAARSVSEIAHGGVTGQHLHLALKVRTCLLMFGSRLNCPFGRKCRL